MTVFTERERAFESKFAHDEEMKFKAIARRNRMVGLWAAGLLHLEGQAAEGYAQDVVRADFEATGRDGAMRKVLADLAAQREEREVRQKMEECLAAAKEQLMREVD